MYEVHKEMEKSFQDSNNSNGIMAEHHADDDNQNHQLLSIEDQDIMRHKSD